MILGLNAVDVSREIQIATPWARILGRLGKRRRSWWLSWRGCSVLRCFHRDNGRMWLVGYTGVIQGIKGRHRSNARGLCSLGSAGFWWVFSSGVIARQLEVSEIVDWLCKVPQSGKWRRASAYWSPVEVQWKCRCLSCCRCCRRAVVTVELFGWTCDSWPCSLTRHTSDVDWYLMLAQPFLPTITMSASSSNTTLPSCSVVTWQGPYPRHTWTTD